MKRRVKIPNILRSRLQQEIHSECPFCAEKQVETFEIHHIDSVPSNNDFNNLIMLCSTCHTKIDKKIISLQTVKIKKNQLALKSAKVELVSIVIDNFNCSWYVSDKNAFAFFDQESPKSPYPLFNFTFINHSQQTIVLKSIHVKHKFLPSGLSGPPLEAGTLKPLIKYHIQFGYSKPEKILNLIEPLFIPAQHPVLFQLEFSEGNSPKEFSQIGGRMYFDLTFLFNDSVRVKAPRIFLNCISLNPKIKVIELA